MHGTKPNSKMLSHISLFIPYLFSQFIFRSHSSYRRQFLFSFFPYFFLSLALSRFDCVCVHVSFGSVCGLFFGIFVFVQKIASVLLVFVAVALLSTTTTTYFIIVRVLSMYFILKYYKSKRMTQSFRSDKLPANGTSEKKTPQNEKNKYTPNGMEWNFMKTSLSA